MQAQSQPHNITHPHRPPHRLGDGQSHGPCKLTMMESVPLKVPFASSTLAIFSGPTMSASSTLLSLASTRGKRIMTPSISGVAWTCVCMSWWLWLMELGAGGIEAQHATDEDEDEDRAAAHTGRCAAAHKDTCAVQLVTLNHGTTLNLPTDSQTALR